MSTEKNSARTSQILPLISELTDAGFIAGDTLETLVHENESLPGLRLSSKSIEQARQLIENGYAAFLAGNFDTALESAQSGHAQLMTRPATAAEDASIRDDIFKALVVRAMATKRKGDALAARGVMEELIRSFPDRELSLRDYGPEAVSLYRKAHAKLSAQPKGTLRIELSDDAAVFVNERYAGRSKIKESIAAGSYRVYVQLGQGAGRVHRATVRANKETVLKVDAGLDRAIRTGRGGPAGLEFSSARDREKHELRFVRRLARRLAVDTVIVIGLRDYRGKPAIIGSVVDVDRGEVTRVAAVIASDGEPSEEEIVALGRFLSHGSKSSRLEILEPGTGRPLGRDTGGGASGWPAVLVGAGVAGVLAGAGTLAAAQIVDCNGARCDQSEKRTLGFATLGIGAVALGVGLYGLWSRDASSASVAVVPTRDGLSVGIGGQF